MPRTEFISITDAAEYLGLNPRTIRMMIADGRLSAYRNGPRVIRLRRDEIDKSMVPYGGAR